MMCKNRDFKLISIIIILILSGFLISFSVNIYIAVSPAKKNMNALAESEQNLGELSSNENPEEVLKIKNNYTYDEFNARIKEIEEMLNLLRKDNKDKSVSGLLSIANTELRYWEIQLDSVYEEVIKNLPENEAANLAKSEKKWIKDREDIAKKAISARGSLIDSLEYTNILIKQTKERIYELLENYKIYIDK